MEQAVSGIILSVRRHVPDEPATGPAAGIRPRAGVIPEHDACTRFGCEPFAATAKSEEFEINSNKTE